MHDQDNDGGFPDESLVEVPLGCFPSSTMVSVRAAKVRSASDNHTGRPPPLMTAGRRDRSG